jgi:hypothetical protein
MSSDERGERITSIDILVHNQQISWSVSSRGGEPKQQRPLEMRLSKRRKETVELLEGLLRHSTDVEQTATDLEKTLDGEEKLYGKLLNVIGHELFDLLFIDALRQEVSDALVALDDGDVDRFRIKLCFTGTFGDWLSRLPWEYARTPPDDPAFRHHGVFLADSAELLLSRRLELGHTRALKVSEWPVKVLLVCSSPVGGRDLGLDAVEAVRVVEKLKELESRGIVKLKELIEPPPPEFLDEDYKAGVTWDEYVKVAQTFKPSIVHFIGHGHCSFGNGALAFAEQNGDVDWVTDDEFTRVANTCKQLRLVFLQACKSALPDPYVSFSGVAQSLAASGVPAVIGMQYRVAASVANEFAVEFYEALLSQRWPISYAVQAARQKLTGQRSDDRLAFGLPVLYLSQDAVLGPPGELRGGPQRTSGVDRGDVDPQALRCPRCHAELDEPDQPVCLTCLLRLRCPEPGCGQRYRDPIGQDRCDRCKTPVRQVLYGDDEVDAVPTVAHGGTTPARAALAIVRGPRGAP